MHLLFLFYFIKSYLGYHSWETLALLSENTSTIHIPFISKAVWILGLTSPSPGFPSSPAHQQHHLYTLCMGHAFYLAVSQIQPALSLSGTHAGHSLHQEYLSKTSAWLPPPSVLGANGFPKKSTYQEFPVIPCLTFLDHILHHLTHLSIFLLFPELHTPQNTRIQTPCISFLFTAISQVSKNCLEQRRC